MDMDGRMVMVGGDLGICFEIEGMKVKQEHEIMAAFKFGLALALVFMVAAALHAEAAVTCGTVAKSLAPCINYLQKGGTVPNNCCSGVKALNSAAKTTADRQAACKCLKDAAGGISGLKQNLISGLPGKCGVSVPYQISPSTDCSK
ncbi:Bifunctional inhibitor/plant lipid transfer protein/seed storage helical domain [Dillenia turbinata]|uniref:Non-specific lipid-transfer protein n=1 Tax=Dillenia turbinata TaxID=194707 RepID=A0AAN8VYQ2_9MAGN